MSNRLVIPCTLWPKPALKRAKHLTRLGHLGVVVLCALTFESRAGAATQPTTTTFTVTSSNGLNPYGLTCSVEGETVSGIPGPTGTITFTDLTTGQSLATTSLAAPVQARTFVPAATFANSYNFVLGDFNGDGNQDLAVGSTTSDDLSVYLGNGDGTFQARKITAGIGAPFPRDFCPYWLETSTETATWIFLKQ